MRDDEKQIAVGDLPPYLRSVLANREYSRGTISAVEMAQEYSAWHRHSIPARIEAMEGQDK